MLDLHIAEKIFTPGFKKEFRHIESGEFELSGIERAGLYLHVPFCKSLCPYCPYDRVMFDPDLSERFAESATKEIEMVSKRTGKISVSSLYIGGGTPTVIGKNLCKVIEAFFKNFEMGGADIFIETSPYDISDEKLSMLKKCGITGISIGVQSFNDKLLKVIGRNYTAEKAYKAVELSKKHFENINIDLMFALPGQKTADFVKDLEIAVSTDVPQITSYPLFTFPYTSVGKFLKIKKVRAPSFSVRKEMFYEMHDFLVQNGFSPVSVWGFKRGIAKTYSSVTRDLYIGFGPSGTTKTKNAFYINTFSVPHYIEKIKSGEFAEVVKADLTEGANNYYWLYWRIYETKVPKEEFARSFSASKKVKIFLNLAKILRFVEEKPGYYQLTKKGIFYVHLMQNRFALNYISKVWGSMMEDPEPRLIRF